MEEAFRQAQLLHATILPGNDGGPAERRMELGKDALARLDEHHPRLGRVDGAEVARQGVPRDLGRRFRRDEITLDWRPAVRVSSGCQALS